MDVVHHVLIGGAVYSVAAAAGQEVAGMAFVAASVAPDMDVAIIAFGRRAYLKNHQAITHSLPLVPLYAFLIAAPLWWLLGSVEWLILAGAAGGLLLHIALDMTNTFGVAPLAPFSGKRYSLDALFFIDSVAFAVTGVFYLSWFAFDAAWAAYPYFAAFAVYVAAKVALHRSVVGKLSPDFAIPSALNPFDFYIMKRTEGGVETFLYNALTGGERRRERHVPPEGRYLKMAGEMAEKSSVYREMRSITRALTVTGVKEGAGGGVTIMARDLAVRNFGGRFGRTAVTFDKEGRVVSEVAHI